MNKWTRVRNVTSPMKEKIQPKPKDDNDHRDWIVPVAILISGFIYVLFELVHPILK